MKDDLRACFAAASALFAASVESGRLGAESMELSMEVRRFLRRTRRSSSLLRSVPVDCISSSSINIQIMSLKRHHTVLIHLDLPIVIGGGGATRIFFFCVGDGISGGGAGSSSSSLFIPPPPCSLLLFKIYISDIITNNSQISRHFSYIFGYCEQYYRLEPLN